jgi:hypothetical protein
MNINLGKREGDEKGDNHVSNSLSDNCRSVLDLFVTQLCGTFKVPYKKGF